MGRMAHMGIDLPPDYDAFRSEVISDQEADDLGVYEVWWLANTWYPDRELSTRLAIAESVVHDLIQAGRVTLVRGAWIGPDHEHEPVADVDEALRDWATWVPQQDAPVVWIVDS